jgi:tetratricopeptide (TPR) repeat protein
MMELMKNILITVLFILMAGFLKAGSTAPDSLVATANNAYNQGNYDLAKELYLSVIQQGLASSELYYNLGNAFFKIDDIPSAILYYEKAKKLNPKEEDINFNLNLANSRVIDKIVPVPEFFLKKWWRQVLQLTSPDGWARSILFVFILFLVFAASFIVSRAVIIRKLSFWGGIVFLILTFFTFVAGSQSHRQFRNEVEGIVFTPTVTVKSSPSENSVDLFVIHEGTKVRILDELEEWSEVRIANGSVGWIRPVDYRPI